VHNIGPRLPKTPSVALSRVQRLNAQGHADLIRLVCSKCENALTDGAAVSVDGETIRIRRLLLS
jgi:hypothetical protein